MPPPMKASRQARPARSSAAMPCWRSQQSGIRLTSGSASSGRRISRGAANQPNASSRSTSPLRPGARRRMIATSSSPRSKDASSARDGSIRSAITTPGWAAASRASTEGISAPTACSLIPIAMRSGTVAKTESALACAAISSRAAGRKRSPSAVSRTSLGWRCSSTLPSRSSSRRMRVLTSDCVVPSASAARVKLASSAVRRKAATASGSSAASMNDPRSISLISS